jgi:hypothetical protein
MPPEKRTKEYRCEGCSKVFTSMMRLQHHKAAEHAPKTLKDIRTMKDIPYSTGSRL